MGQYAAQQDLAPGMWHQSPPACSLHCTAFWREWKPPLMYVASGPGSRAFLCLTQGPPSEGYYSPPPPPTHTPLLQQASENRITANSKKLIGTDLPKSRGLPGRCQVRMPGRKVSSHFPEACICGTSSQGKNDHPSLWYKVLWRGCYRASG